MTPFREPLLTRQSGVALFAEPGVSAPPVGKLADTFVAS
jgi:hypothetical protein